jgi:hypothetical protein
MAFRVKNTASKQPSREIDQDNDNDNFEQEILKKYRFIENIPQPITKKLDTNGTNGTDGTVLNKLVLNEQTKKWVIIKNS